MLETDKKKIFIIFIFCLSWINKKIRDRNEELRQEKMEHKKWLSRRRKSRKHQRLSQALEMAQAYGYNNAYYLPGFNF